MQPQVDKLPSASAGVATVVAAMMASLSERGVTNEHIRQDTTTSKSDRYFARGTCGSNRGIPASGFEMGKRTEPS